MDRNFKVCLILSGAMVFLLGLVLIGSLALVYLNKDKIAKGFEDWTEDVKQHVEEGKTFGEETDQDGCLGEALRQSEGKGSFGALPPSLFLTGCLKTAHESEGFCDDAPEQTEIVATALWSQRRCGELDRAGDQACVQIMQSMQRHCQEGAG